MSILKVGDTVIVIDGGSIDMLGMYAPRYVGRIGTVRNVSHYGYTSCVCGNITVLTVRFNNFLPTLLDERTFYEKDLELYQEYQLPPGQKRCKCATISTNDICCDFLKANL